MIEDEEFPLDNPTEEQLDQLRSDSLALLGVSTTPTRYAVICVLHGRVYMTKEEYDKQMYNADDKWVCPQCRSLATFDDETYDERA